MAGPKKKLCKPINQQASSEESYSEDSASEQECNDVQATFEGRNPEGQDFHGIKQLLQQLFSTAHVDTSQISDMLIAQLGLGSVLKQSYSESDDEEDIEMIDDSDVYGITSILNLTNHKGTPCVQQLYELVDEMSKMNADKETQAVVKKILTESNKLGLLVNERFINIPAKIAAPMLSSLQEEFHRIKKKENSYNFEYFLMICKAWKPKETAGNSEISFANEEEQIIMSLSDIHFEYCLSGKNDTGLTGKWHSDDKELVPYRVVILFKADKFDSIINAVKNFVNT